MWTKAQQNEAQGQGWGVFDVWTGTALRPMVLPLKFTPKMPHATAMLRIVISQARARDPLCIAALQHISMAQKK
jgi:hypothetical protein